MKKRGILAVLCLFLSIGLWGQQNTYTWGGGSGDWTDSNWVIVPGPGTYPGDAASNDIVEILSDSVAVTGPIPNSLFSLEIGSGAALDTGTDSVTISGACINDGTITGLIELGSAAISGSGTFDDVLVVSGATCNVGSNINITGSLEIDSTGTLNVAGYTVGDGTTTPTSFSNSGTLQINGTQSLGPPLNNSTSGTVIFGGNSTNLAGITYFHNLTITTGTHALNTGITVSGTLTQNGGTLGLGGFTVTAGTVYQTAGTIMTAGATISATVGVTQSGTGTITGGILNLSGASAFVLTNPGNAITTLTTTTIAPFPTAISYADSDGLAVGPVTTSGGTNTITLIAGGPITQSGAINTGTLSATVNGGSSGDGITFGGTNMVTGNITLDTDATDGDITLHNTVDTIITSIDAGTGAITIETPDGRDISFDGLGGNPASVTLRTDIGAVNNIGTGTVTIGSAISVGTVYVWTHAISGSAITSTVGGIELRLDDNPPNSFLAALNPVTSLTIGPRASGMHIEYGPVSTIAGAFFIDSTAGTGPVSLTTSGAGNIYLVDVGLTSREVTTTAQGTGFIEFRGIYNSSEPLTLSPASALVQFNNSAAVTLISNFDLTGIDLLLLDDASINAVDIILGGKVDGTYDFTLQASGNINITGLVGDANPLDDIIITTAANVTFDGTVEAASFTQSAGTATVFNADQNYTADFSFIGTALSLNNVLTTGGAVVINNTGTFTTSTTGSISAGGYFSQTGSGVNSIGANITAVSTNPTIPAIKFAQSITLTGDAAFNATPNAAGDPSIDVMGVSGSYNLTLAGDDGIVTLRDTISISGSFLKTGSGATVLAATPTNSITSYVGAISFAGPITGSGKNLTLATTGGGNVTVSGTVGDNTYPLGDLVVNSTGGGSSFGGDIFAASFTKDTSAVTTGGITFNADQNYTAGFTFFGANLIVNGTLTTDTDTDGDGPIAITVSGTFTVGASGSIQPGGSGGIITVTGNTLNNGSITVSPLVSAGDALIFDGSYTVGLSADPRSIVGNTGYDTTIVFKGDVNFYAFTHNGDTVQFSTSTFLVTAHSVSRVAGAADYHLADVIIDTGNTVTVTSGIVTQDPAGTGRTLTLTDNAVLTTFGSWFIGPPSTLPSPWFMLSNPESAAGPGADSNYINPAPAFTSGFAGFTGSLTMGNGAVLNTVDFYTQISTFTLTAPSGTGEMCNINASGNVTINKTFVHVINSTLTMNGGGNLAVRTHDDSPNPRIVDVEIGKFVANSATDTVINSDILFTDTVTINPGMKLTTHASGTPTVPSPHIHMTGALWEQTNGTFTPQRSIVEFGERVSLPGTKTYTIRGNTTWYDFVCKEKGATIQFSNWTATGDAHKVAHSFIVNPVLPGDVPSSFSPPEDYAVKIQRETNLGDPSVPPPSSPSSHFWVFDLATTGTMDINFIRIKYSYSTRKLPAPPELNFSWYIMAWPYFDSPSNPVNSPVESFWNIDWFVFANFFYSFTEDSDHNGKIDRIRAQSAFELNGDFSDFAVTVDGYSVTGYTLAGTSYDTIDSIYINLREQDYTDGGATLRWRVVRNNSLKDLTTGSYLMGNVGEEMTTVDTVPPRINYTLTLPETSAGAAFIQMSEPVYHSGVNPWNASSISLTDVLHGGTPALTPLGSRTFRDLYGPIGDGASEYLFTLSTAFTLDDLASGTNNFTVSDVYDMAEPARDLHAGHIVNPNLDSRFWYIYPSPKYPIDWDYSKYVYVWDNSYTDTTTRPTHNQLPSDTTALIPPHRMVDLGTVSTPIPPAYPYTGFSIDHRVTDLLISVPPKDVGDTRYFVWPLWAKYDNSATYSGLGDTENLPGYGYMNPDNPFNDTDVIWDFTGRRFLERDDIVLQARVGDPSFTLSSNSLVFDFSVAPVYRRSYGETNLWLPDLGTLPSDAAFFINLVPRFKPGYQSNLPVVPNTSLFNFTFLQNLLAPKSDLDFFFHLDTTPTNLFVGRLDINPGDPIPNDWYNRVKPFTFGVHDITRQRGGVTILNNVINSNNRENVLLDYKLDKSGRVTVQVFTLDGNLVKVLVRENQSAKEEYYRVAWDGTNNGGRPVARGMYFIRIVAPDIDEIRKVMVVK